VSETASLAHADLFPPILHPSLQILVVDPFINDFYGSISALLSSIILLLLPVLTDACLSEPRIEVNHSSSSPRESPRSRLPSLAVFFCDHYWNLNLPLLFSSFSSPARSTSEFVLPAFGHKMTSHTTRTSSRQAFAY